MRKEFNKKNIQILKSVSYIVKEKDNLILKPKM